MGVKVSLPSFIVLWSDSELKTTRLGIIATKKFGNSCERNRFKRSIREAFRLHSYRWNFCYDFLVIAKKFALQKNATEIADEWNRFIFENFSKHSNPFSLPMVK